MEYCEKDGLIYDQRLCKGLKYGFVDSSKNGCGWVACYNLFRLLGISYSADGVRKSMQAWLPFGGLVGTHIVPLYIWVRKHTKLKIGVVNNYTPVRLKKSRCGIVWYFTGKGLHFAAFSKEKNNTFRFYNAVYGKKDLCCTLPEFCKQYSKFSRMLVLGVPAKTPKGSAFETATF